MKELIACCGLDCESCDARIATLTGDNALREKTAKLWSELNGVTITPEMINCTGCRVDGVKTPYCENLCPIRQCVLKKGFTTCGECPERDDCHTVGAVWESNPEAKKRLHGNEKISGNDMIIGLYNLPSLEIPGNIKLKRAFVGDKELILNFVEKNFQKNWVYEVEHALMAEVSKCFIASEGGRILGFACFDSSAKGFFGPIGVDPSRRGEKIGQALLLRTLNAMREYGYGYAIIGWVSDAEPFYRKTVGAEYIRGGSPERSVYSNLVMM